jgi:hypothetical protein
MQTGSSGTLIGWKSGQTTFVPLWDRMEGAWLQTQVSRARAMPLSFENISVFRELHIRDKKSKFS